jgi:uncharacterized protein (TIGR00297 family)
MLRAAENELPMDHDTTPTPWTKAIPPARDRLQSRILVFVAVPVLCCLTIVSFRQILAFGGRYVASTGRFDDTITKVVLVSFIFALAAWRLRAATPLAAVCGGMICFLITGMTQWAPGSSMFHSGLSPLLLLFILTFEATRLGRERKVVARLAESRKGRTASQVIANLGVAATLSSSWGLGLTDRILEGWGFDANLNGELTFLGMLYLPMLAALAEATADTVSSEIGQAFGGQPILLTTFRRVPPGTDGAISPLGTLAGIAAAAIIAASGAPAMGMSLAECAVAFAAAILGLFFDSILGATLERRGWIGNDLVNFASTAFAAAVGLLALRLFSDSITR